MYKTYCKGGEYLIGKCFRFLLVNVFWITDIYKCICNCVTIIIVSWFFIIYFYKFQSSPPNKLVIALMSEVSCIWYVEMFKNVKEQRMSHRLCKNFNAQTCPVLSYVYYKCCEQYNFEHRQLYHISDQPVLGCCFYSYLYMYQNLVYS